MQRLRAVPTSQERSGVENHNVLCSQILINLGSHNGQRRCPEESSSRSCQAFRVPGKC